MSGGIRKAVSQLIRRARKIGWRVEMAGNGHWRFINPETGAVAYVAATPGTYGSLKFDVAKLRRAGLPRCIIPT